ncbi:MAG: glycosyltransferase family 39 protein [Candidatus Aminicenantes bacterium]|nr:glycosyltransferase family 39 protein [Candidatus Aminicenantes bacterium]
MKHDGYFKLKNIFQGKNVLLVLLASVKLLVHLATNLFGGYGFFRDEFYYLACSKHMAWGYVDQPPFSIAALWLNRHLFGDSLFALRLLPAVAGAATVFLAGLIARELGGERFAQALAACSVITAPLLLGMNSFFSMNSFDILFWTLALYLVAVITENEAPKYWLLLGLVLGLGLLNKISVLWLGAGLFVGLLLATHRKLLLMKKAWIAAGIAFMLFLPHVIWQVVNHFPTLEFIRNASAEKYAAVSPLAMFKEQIMNMNQLTFLFWLPGMVYFLVANPAKRFRIFPIIYLAVFCILAVNGSSKSEYLGPLFPMLFALGAVAFEKFILKVKWHRLKPVFLLLLLLSGVALAPFAIGVLSVERYIAYAQALGNVPSTPEKKELAKLPQFYADRFGWEKMVAAVAGAYGTLTAEEKATCAIVANNYGEAGAIDFFGSKYGLPKAICGHNNYWLWGARGASGEVVIRLGGSLDAMMESYREVVRAGMFHDDYCMPFENDMVVWILKERLRPLQDDWAEFKHFE